MRTNEQEPKPIHRNYSKLLISESPLQVLPTLAIKIGLNEALMLQQVHYWISNPLNKNVRNGRVWVYKTYEEWQAEFPFWSLRTIQRTSLNLEDLGILLSSIKHNQKRNDRTKWYTIDYEKLDSLDVGTSCQAGTTVMPSWHYSDAKVAHSIPETTSEITTENNNDNARKVIELPKKQKKSHVEPKPELKSNMQSDSTTACMQTDTVCMQTVTKKPKLTAEPKLEPNGSVVVNGEIDDLVKMVVGWAISRVMLETWAKKHGVDYVLQKIELTKSAIGLNLVRKPGAYLNKAIELDWQPPAPDECGEVPDKPAEPTFPTHEENVAWYDKLAENEKLTVLSEAVRKNPYLEEHLKNANTSVLDTGFSNSTWFKMMMSNVGRAA